MKTKSPTKRWLKENHQYLRKPIIILSLLSLVLSLTAIFFAFFSRTTIDAATEGNSRTFIISAVIISSILLLQIVASAFNQYMKSYYFGFAQKALRGRVYQRILGAKITETSVYHSGELMNFIVSDVETVSDAIIDIWPKIVFYFARFTGAFILLYILDMWFAIGFFIFGIILFLGSRIVSGPIKRRHNDLKNREAALRGYLQETIEHRTVIKAFESEKLMGERLKALEDDHFSAFRSKQSIQILSSTGMQIFFAFGYAFAIIFGAMRLMENAVSFGTLIALIQLVGHIQSPFSGLSHLVPKYYQMLASSDRLLMIDSFDQEFITDKRHIEYFDKIVAKNLQFAYQKKPVILDLNFVVPKKSFVQIIGESGQGKTTLMKLLLGLIEPQGGFMTFINNRQKTVISPETRNAFAYVPQGNLILSGTIRENLELYRKADDAKLKWATSVACIYNDIMKLPDRFETRLGEGGAGLSEGQIQRLAIARALLKDAPILLLDEITSAIDRTTEEKIYSNIKSLTEKTCFVISHRILNPDLIDMEIIIKHE